MSRLIGHCPFRSGSYKQSMYLNYKCEINTEVAGAPHTVSDLLARMVAKTPEDRLRADEALEHEAILSEEMDELPFKTPGSPLSLRMDSYPTTAPTLKDSLDNREDFVCNSRVESLLLHTNFIRFENSEIRLAFSPPKTRQDVTHKSASGQEGNLAEGDSHSGDIDFSEDEEEKQSVQLSSLLQKYT